MRAAQCCIWARAGTGVTAGAEEVMMGLLVMGCRYWAACIGAAGDEAPGDGASGDGPFHHTPTHPRWFPSAFKVKSLPPIPDGPKKPFIYAKQDVNKINLLAVYFHTTIVIMGAKIINYNPIVPKAMKIINLTLFSNDMC